MANIKVELSHDIIDGQPVTFVAPCDCTAITGLKVCHPGGSKVFVFKDAHGNTLTGIGNLFAKGAYVKAVLDVNNGFAYIQNADTNAYLEAQLANKLGFKRHLTKDDDVDALTEHGVYAYSTDVVTNGLKNAPFPNAAVIFVYGTDNSTSQKIQLAFRYGEPGNFKFRPLYSSTWLAWKQCATTDYADSKMGMDLLWENASPNSSFAAQDLALNTEGYDYLAVAVKYNEKDSNGAELNFVWMRERGGGDTIATVTAHLISTTGTYNTVARKFTIGSIRTKLMFEDGVGSGGSTSNTNAIPFRIYGVRGGI